MQDSLPDNGDNRILDKSSLGKKGSSKKTALAFNAKYNFPSTLTVPQALATPVLASNEKRLPNAKPNNVTPAYTNGSMQT